MRVVNVTITIRSATRNLREIQSSGRIKPIIRIQFRNRHRHLVRHIRTRLPRRFSVRADHAHQIRSLAARVFVSGVPNVAHDRYGVSSPIRQSRYSNVPVGHYAFSSTALRHLSPNTRRKFVPFVDYSPPPPPAGGRTFHFNRIPCHTCHRGACNVRAGE